MKKFMLIYTGDNHSGPKTKEEGMKMIEDWKNWYGNIGERLLDGGFPFKEGAVMTDGESENPTDLPVHGYLLIEAMDYDEAMGIAKEAPLPTGGNMHVFEEQDVPGMS